MTTELKYQKLLELLADAATRIDFNKDGNYTAVTTRVFLDGNVVKDFVDGSPRQVLIKKLDEKLEAWASLNTPG